MYLNHIHPNSPSHYPPGIPKPSPSHFISSLKVFILALNMRKSGLTQRNSQASADGLSQ